TEVARPRVAAAELVANPGCYPTAALLALLPLAREGLIDAAREVVIDAASGVTGAGRAPQRELMFGEVAEDFRAYAVGNEHRHLPELLADRKSTRLNSSHRTISYAVFCLKKKKRVIRWIGLGIAGFSRVECCWNVMAIS